MNGLLALTWEEIPSENSKLDLESPLKSNLYAVYDVPSNLSVKLDRKLRVSFSQISWIHMKRLILDEKSLFLPRGALNFIQSVTHKGPLTVDKSRHGAFVARVNREVEL